VNSFADTIYEVHLVVITLICFCDTSMKTIKHMIPPSMRAYVGNEKNSL